MTALRVTAPPGVYRPRGDTRLIATAIPPADGPGAASLDVCTGTGVLALLAAARGYRATAVDVSRRACVAARINARRNDLAVRVLCGDLFAPVPGGRFALITANPPYLPSPEARVRRRSRAWDAGPGGREVIDRICREAAAHLEPGGTLLLVQSSLADVPATLEAMRRGGLRPRVAARHRGPYGPIMRERLALLDVPAADRGAETLTVIAGRRQG